MSLLSSFASLARASAALSLACVACGSSKTECTCESPVLKLRIPPERAAFVVDVALSGPACAGVQATCEATSAGACVLFAFNGRAAGTCHVDVDFSTGPARFSADARLVAGGCCSGFYADPRSAGDIDVPGLAGDAGGAG